MLTRRMIPAGVALVLAATVNAFCTLPSLAADQLAVGLYGGVWETYVKQGVIAAFEKATGAKVVTETAADSQFITKLRASGGKNPVYDLMPLQPYSVATMAAAGLVQPLDTSKIPNWANVSPALAKQMTVNGKVYAVPFTVAQLALAYRTDMVTKKPTSWLDLFSPEYQSCGVALSPPTATGGGPETLSGLAKALGGSLGDPATVDKVFAQIEAGKKSVKAFPATTADMQTLLQRGDVCLAPHWDGRIVQMKQSGIPIALAYPKEGGIAGMNGFALATGAADPELAYKFLNFVLDPASQAIFANQIFYTMSNTTTTYGDVFNANHPNGLPDLNAAVWLDHDVMVKNSADWQSRWEKIFR